MKIVSRAKWIGMDKERRQQGGTPAIIEADGVLFFSLSALSEAAQINAAAEKLVNQSWLTGTL